MVSKNLKKVAGILILLATCSCQFSSKISLHNLSDKTLQIYGDEGIKTLHPKEKILIDYPDSDASYTLKVAARDRIICYKMKLNFEVNNHRKFVDNHTFYGYISNDLLLILPPESTSYSDMEFRPYSC